MPTSNRKLSIDDIGVLLLISAVLFGAWLRLSIPEAAGFPINDGGLFYRMIQGLQANHYRLPETVQYNGLSIPFAYPPLAFYFAAFVSDLFRISLLEVLRWVPALILIALIPAVYLLAALVLQSRFQAGLAALIYALLPASLTWLIMGGGITRSLGQLFLVLTLYCVFTMYTKRERKYAIGSMVFGALVVLTHPEAAIHTAGIALLMWAFYGRDREGAIKSALVAAGIVALTAPWWLTMLLRFGAGPFLSAMQTGSHGLKFLAVLLLPFSAEPLLALFALLAVLGIAVRMARKEYFVPLWFVVPFVIEPRNAQNVAIIPLVVLASSALAELILPALSEVEAARTKRSPEGPLQSLSAKLLLAYLLGCLVLGAQNYSVSFSRQHVSPNAREAFQWIQQQTSPGSRFLNLTGITDVVADPTNEWFPVLTERVSLTTVQGYEWIDAGKFAERIHVVQRLQQCNGAPAALACVEDTAQQAMLSYEYLLVARKASGTLWGDHLISEVKNSSQYELAFQGDDIVIFRRVK